MTKTIKKLEKENAGLRRKCSATDVTLIDMVDQVRGILNGVWFFPWFPLVSKGRHAHRHRQIMGFFVLRRRAGPYIQFHCTVPCA